tara:strand:- start:30 stop:449 length:420 start_codon:yes stop_codon:yes gene_type:complete
MCTHIASYYSGAALVSGSSALKTKLNTIISSHTVVSYDNAWSALRDLDASPSDAARVKLIYSSHTHHGTDDQGVSTGWNREHSWPKSYGVGYSGPDYSDLHHLFPADWNVKCGALPGSHLHSLTRKTETHHTLRQGPGH